MTTSDAPRVYLSGLDLQGRRVLVAGAGRIATRRLPRLLECGAVVEVVAPLAGAEVQQLAEAGVLTWHPREVRPEDVEGAWYVLAATSNPQANAELSRAAESRRVFCVRADSVHEGSAWTVSVARLERHLVGVLGNRDPRGTTGLLRRIVALLGDHPDPAA